ncbi:hypothetical protein PtB15_12B108 [Puccinia triticina]|nr:hypothetical protein PtB15_12B108 [Puccinia triticina]
MPKRRRGGSPPPFRMNAQELLEWIGPVLRRVAAYLPPQMIVPMVPGYGPTPVRRPAPPAAPLPSEVKRLKRRAPFLCRSAKRLTLDELNAQALSATSPPARHPRLGALGKVSTKLHQLQLQAKPGHRAEAGDVIDMTHTLEADAPEVEEPEFKT